MEPITPICDVCGRPATSWAMDTLEGRDENHMYLRYVPVGRQKFGCAEHPQRSITYQTGMVLPLPEKT